MWVTNDWDSIIPNLVSGNFDAIIAGMSATVERDEVIDFTNHYFPPDPSVYVAATGATDAATQGVIAVQSNTIQASFLAESGATFVEFSTPDETIAAVTNGEADAVLSGLGYLNDVVESSGGNLTFVGEQLSIGGGVAIGLRESDTELKAKMNEAIASMEADGSLEEMIAKWFKKETTE